MTLKFSGTGIQTWTTADSAAVDMKSKAVRLSYSSSPKDVPGDLLAGSGARQLDYVRDVSQRSRRFRTLARDASRLGKRLVIEIHDRNPVKTIATQATA
jgi:hypothetical protein